jgi:hypothetical protein
MTRLPRRLAVSAITVLAAGACAGPALAAQQTPLARTIARVETGTRLNLDESLGTRASDHQAINQLVSNAYARQRAIARVSAVPATGAQRAAKAEWLTGIRAGVQLDVQCANAVFTMLSGNEAAGRRELNSQSVSDLQFRVNKLTSQADQALGIE